MTTKDPGAEARGTREAHAGREPKDPREPGYRGTLPPREDRLARPWLLAVVAIFVAIMLLSILAVPSRFLPDPTVPTPIVSPSASASASASAGALGSAEASASGEPSASAGTSGSAEASATP